MTTKVGGNPNQHPKDKPPTYKTSSLGVQGLWSILWPSRFVPERPVVDAAPCNRSNIDSHCEIQPIAYLRGYLSLSMRLICRPHLVAQRPTATLKRHVSVKLTSGAHTNGSRFYCVSRIRLACTTPRTSLLFFREYIRS